jgi:enolase
MYMIKDAKLYSVFNSKGKKAVKIKLVTDKGVFHASVPSGASVGANEAVELPEDKVKKAFSHVRSNIKDMDENDLITADNILKQIDGSDNFRNIGGNLALAISVAVAKAATDNEIWKLDGGRKDYRFPIPLGNVIGGGAHGGKSSWQEYLILPYRARSPQEAAQINFDIWKLAGDELAKRDALIGRNIENAWMTTLDDLETLDFLAEITKSFKVKLGIDFAASGFYKDGKYEYPALGKTLSRDSQIEFVRQAAESYDLFFLEDPFHEEDFQSFAELNKRLKGRLVVGDDLICTNKERILKALHYKSINAAIIKPNQIGTLTQTQEAIDLMETNRLTPVVSHRSGTTEDYWLADLAVLWKVPIIKIGCLGGDLPKHNRLMELWDDVPRGRMADLT